MGVDEIIARLGGAKEAAERLGLKRSTVAMWKTNGHLPPRHVAAVARALGVSLDAVWPASRPPAPQPRQEAA